MSFIHHAVACFYRWRNRQLTVGRQVKIDPRAFIARGGAVTLGDGAVVRAGAMLLPSGGFIRLGRLSSINHYAVLNGQGGVTIGDKVMIAAFASLFAANHNFDDVDVPIQEQGLNTRGGIVIEDDVWIGTHAVILDGVTIGTGSVVGAGAVVTRTVPPFSVVAGVPARVIRQREKTPIPRTAA